MIKIKKYVFATFDVEGFHSFPEAASLPQFATGDKYDVSFLSTKHRHIFKFKIWVEVNDSNREIEFFQLKRKLQSVYHQSVPEEFGNRSCEMIAEELYQTISKWYPYSDIKIEVSEDGENGAYLEFNLVE